MARRSSKSKVSTGKGGEENGGRKAALRTGTASTNPDRVLPSSKKQGSFYRSRGTIKLLNLYKSKPSWLQGQKQGSQKKKRGTQKTQRPPQPTAPARVEPDRRWFGNVRVVDQQKLALFREEMSKAVNDPYSVVLRRSRLPLSLLSGGGGGGGKTHYYYSGGAYTKDTPEEDEEEEEVNEEKDITEKEQIEKEEEERIGGGGFQQSGYKLSGAALLSLQPFADVFGCKSQRKRPQLGVHSLASFALQGERRRERYMKGTRAGVGGKRISAVVVGCSSSNSNSSTQQGMRVPDDERAAATGGLLSDGSRDWKEEDGGSSSLPSEEIFKKGTSKRIWSVALPLKDALRRYCMQELYKVVDASDVLVQVLDARDPLGTRCRRLEQYLRKHKQAKHIVFLLNKVDLVPNYVARGWVEILSKESPTLLFQAKRQERPAGKLQLFQLLRQYAHLMADKKHVSVGFIGYPNVGKSSIINALRNKQVCAAAPVPGHTRVWQYVALTKRLYLIDCPGVVPASEDISDSLKVLRGVVRPERIQCPEEHIDELLNRVQPDHLRARYGLPDTCTWSGAEDFLEIVAKKKGRLRKGGEADISTTARIVLYDLQRGRLPYFVPPPAADGGPHISASSPVATGTSFEAPKASTANAEEADERLATAATASETISTTDASPLFTDGGGATPNVSTSETIGEAAAHATAVKSRREKRQRHAPGHTLDREAPAAAQEEAGGGAAPGSVLDATSASSKGERAGRGLLNVTKKRRTALERSIEVNC